MKVGIQYEDNEKDINDLKLERLSQKTISQDKDWHYWTVKQVWPTRMHGGDHNIKNSEPGDAQIIIVEYIRSTELQDPNKKTNNEAAAALEDIGT